jgi:serine/threonine protein phosphatase PrpC
MDNQIQTKEGSRELISLMENENESSMAGCTANVCLMAKKVLYCANSGDSRSVIRKNTVKYYLL